MESYTPWGRGDHDPRRLGPEVGGRDPDPCRAARQEGRDRPEEVRGLPLRPGGPPRRHDPDRSLAFAPRPAGWRRWRTPSTATRRRSAAATATTSRTTVPASASRSTSSSRTSAPSGSTRCRVTLLVREPLGPERRRVRPGSRDAQRRTGLPGGQGLPRRVVRPGDPPPPGHRLLGSVPDGQQRPPVQHRPVDGRRRRPLRRDARERVRHHLVRLLPGRHTAQEGRGQGRLHR